MLCPSDQWSGSMPYILMDATFVVSLRVVCGVVVGCWREMSDAGSKFVRINTVIISLVEFLYKCTS